MISVQFSVFRRFHITILCCTFFLLQSPSTPLRNDVYASLRFAITLSFTYKYRTGVLIWILHEIIFRDRPFNRAHLRCRFVLPLDGGSRKINLCKTIITIRPDYPCTCSRSKTMNNVFRSNGSNNLVPNTPDDSSTRRPTVITRKSIRTFIEFYIHTSKFNAVYMTGRTGVKGWLYGGMLFVDIVKPTTGRILSQFSSAANRSDTGRSVEGLDAKEFQ